MRSLLLLAKPKLTCFEAVEIWTSGNIDRSAVQRYRGVEDSDKPPVDDHGPNSVYQFLEQEKIAEFHRYYRAPGQDQGDSNELLENKGLFDEVRRKLNAWRVRLGRSHQIHFVDKGEKQSHRGYQTADAEQENAIIKRKVLLHTNPNIKSGARADQA